MSRYYIERDARDGFYELRETDEGELLVGLDPKEIPDLIAVLQDALRDHADAPPPTVKDPRQ